MELGPKFWAVELKGGEVGGATSREARDGLPDRMGAAYAEGVHLSINFSSGGLSLLRAQRRCDRSSLPVGLLLLDRTP